MRPIRGPADTTEEDVKDMTEQLFERTTTGLDREQKLIGNEYGMSVFKEWHQKFDSIALQLESQQRDIDSMAQELQSHQQTIESHQQELDSMAHELRDHRDMILPVFYDYKYKSRI